MDICIRMAMLRGKMKGKRINLSTGKRETRGVPISDHVSTT